jgi:Ion channel
MSWDRVEMGGPFEMTLAQAADHGKVLLILCRSPLTYSVMQYPGSDTSSGSVSKSRKPISVRAGRLEFLTLATAGYGHMYPETFYGHCVTTVEIVVGMFGMAVITGLIFVRFSRPTARILFSKCAVISPFDGVPTLMLRVATSATFRWLRPNFASCFPAMNE